MEPLYTRDILRLAAGIPGQMHFADLPDAAELRSPTCGSRMRVAVTLDADGQVVSMRQAVEACAFGQASAALMGAAASGRTADDACAALAGIESWLAGADGEPWPGFDQLAPVRAKSGRHGAVLLPFRALLAAIEAAE